MIIIFTVDARIIEGIHKSSRIAYGIGGDNKQSQVDEWSLHFL
jgi:hypothetical protein